MADKMMRIAGRTANGTAVPMLADTSGNISTTRVWKRAWVSVIEPTQVRDTNNVEGTLDLRDVSMCSLRITNRLGVPVSIRFKTDINTTNGYELVDTDGASIIITVQPTNNYVIITPEDLPLLNYVQYLRVVAKASSAPESGGLEVCAVTIK